MIWVKLDRPDVGVDSSPGVLRVRLESVVGLEGGPDDPMTSVLLQGGTVRLVAGTIDSVQAKIDAVDRMSRAVTKRRQR